MIYIDGPQGRRTQEFNVELHPDVRNLVWALDKWSVENGIPEVEITECFRTVEEQEHIYFGYFKRLIATFESQGKLQSGEANIAISMRPKSDDELKKIAREKFSWHMVHCATDIRTITSGHYTVDQAHKVFEFLKSKAKPESKWELLAHDVAGPHIHIGLRDFNYRAKYDTRKEKKS